MAIVGQKGPLWPFLAQLVDNVWISLYISGMWSLRLRFWRGVEVCPLQFALQSKW